MTRVLVARLRPQAGPPRRLRRRAPDRSRDRRRIDVDPRARTARTCSTTGSSSPRSGSCSSSATGTPTRGTRASATSSTAAPRCTSRRSGSRTPAIRDGAYAEALDLTAAHQSSYGREAAGVLAAAVAEAMRPGATVDSVVEASPAAREGRHADGDRGRRRPRGEARRLARRRPRRAAAAFAPFDSVGEHYAQPAQNARIPSRLHAIEELPIALGLLVATGGDYDGDGARRRQLRPRLRLDRLDGRRARGRARRRRCAATGSTSRRGEQDRPRGAGVGAWPRSPRRSSPRDLHATRSGRRRWPPSPSDEVPCLRVTWVQPEDLVGHELRQAREEGKDVDGVEERWLRAGGAPAPGRGASQESGCAGAAIARARAARRARRAAAPARGGRAGGLRGDPRRGRSRDRLAASDLPGRIAGAWLGRAAGCVLGKPVENIPRDGIRAIAEATGNWPVARLVHGRGPAGGGLRALAVEPRQPADEPGREHRRHPRGRRPQLHDARRRAARALRHRLRRARRREDLARLPAAGPDLHRRAGRDAQPARGLPAAPRRRRGATRSASGSAPGCASTRTAGPPAATRSPRRGWRGRTRASATPRTASTRRCSWRRRTPPRSARARRRQPAPTPASRSCRPRAGLPRRCGRRASWPGCTGRRSVDELYARYGGYHWVHAINNTALVAAALYAFDGDFSGGDLRGRPGRLGHRHERRRGRLDPRRASEPTGSRSAGRRRSAAASRARCPASTRSRSTSSPRGRSPWPARPQRREHPARAAARPARAAADRPADRRAARPGRRSRALDAAKIFAAPDDPADWPAWRDALTRWREEAAARIGYDGAAYDAPGLGWTQSCFVVALALALGRAALRPRRRPLHARRASRRGRARVRRLRRHRALARVSGDRDRRAQPVRLLPRRARAPRARCRPPGARRPRLRRLQPVGRRHAARAGRRRRRAIAELVRELGVDGVFLDTMKEARPGLRAALDARPASRSRASRRCRSRASRPPPLVGAVVRRQPRARRAPREVVRAAAHAPPHPALEPRPPRGAAQRLAERRRHARLGERLRRLGRLERARQGAAAGDASTVQRRHADLLATGEWTPLAAASAGHTGRRLALERRRDDALGAREPRRATTTGPVGRARRRDPGAAGSPRSSAPTS